MTKSRLLMYFYTVFTAASHPKNKLTATPSNTSGPYDEPWDSLERSNQEENKNQMEKSVVDDDTYDNLENVKANINKKDSGYTTPEKFLDAIMKNNKIFRDGHHKYDTPERGVYDTPEADRSQSKTENTKNPNGETELNNPILRKTSSILKQNNALNSELKEFDPGTKEFNDGLVNASIRHNVGKIRPKVRINPQVSVSNIPPRDYDETE